jgi:hypothetical protein
MALDAVRKARDLLNADLRSPLDVYMGLMSIVLKERLINGTVALTDIDDVDG